MLTPDNNPTLEHKLQELNLRLAYLQRICSAAQDRKEKYNKYAHRVTFLKKKPSRQLKIVKRFKVAENLEIEASTAIETLQSEIQKLSQAK